MRRDFNFYAKKAVHDAIEYRRLSLLAFGNAKLCQNKLFNAGNLLFQAEQTFTTSIKNAYQCKKRYSASEKKRLFKILKAGFINWRKTEDWKKAFNAWNKL
nr:MAG TPA: hypothetical protein [Caudoviricetes sp.]